MIRVIIREREPINAGARALFLSNAAEERIESLGPLHRIVPESFLIAEWRMIRPQSTRKAQMKTILMLIVGLMLAGCGSTGNHVRNRDAVDRNRYLVEHNVVDTICACP